MATRPVAFDDTPEPGSDWPPAVEVINEKGQGRVVLLCEHASPYVPSEYERLGLSRGDLLRHIGWDIGAAEVTRRLSALIDAPAFLGTYSRLLIDLNRPPDILQNEANVPASIPQRSEATDIPGNRNLSAAEVERRRKNILDPFHHRVSAHLDDRKTESRPTRLVTIHSFTPSYLGQSRPWHCGVLFSHSGAYAETVMRSLKGDPSIIVGANVPYEITEDADYAIPIHGEARGLDAVMIEIRQDLIAGSAGAKEWADRLARAL